MIHRCPGVNVALLNTVEYLLMNTRQLVSNKRRLKQNFGSSEALIANPHDLTIWQNELLFNRASCRQRWVIVIKKKQLPNTLPIISILSNWVKKANFQLLIINYQLLRQKDVALNI